MEGIIINEFWVGKKMWTNTSLNKHRKLTGIGLIIIFFLFYRYRTEF
jgi:hypothetical protein